jgi:hypothetical protein
MSLAELDAQDVTLLPERATLYRGGGSVFIVHQVAIASVYSAGFINIGNENTALATIINL